MNKKKKNVVDAISVLMNPRSIAVIGASRDPDSVGHGVLLSLLNGCVRKNGECKSFGGRVYAVNPNADEILGVKCFPTVQAIPEPVDVAVIAVPAKIVPNVMRSCAAKKIRVAVVISAGFAELGVDSEGAVLQKQVLEIARRNGIRVLGPNVLGLLRPPTGLNASFAPSAPPSGGIAFVTQSGALADSEIDVALRERHGFSAIVSLGNQADFDASDFIEWFSRDGETKSIAVYLEGLRAGEGRKFLRAARNAAKKKPVIVLKGGRSVEGARAVSSHTAVLAGSPKVFDSVLAQAGCIRAEGFEDLFDLTNALALQPRAKQNAVAVVTNGGGAGVLCADYAREFGLNLVPLRRETIEKIDASGKMHSAWSRANPLDIVGDALPERYASAINVLLAEDYVHGLIVLQTLQTMTRPEEDARVVIEAHSRFPKKPVVCAFLGGRFSRKSIELLRENGIPDYNDPRKAVRAMAALCGALK
ncbi:CoA-binding protein [Candidatus Micrarchaeota archaeon]|nr:CoA-binding protein [Candidatus Micrarchaeota archaeon]